MTDPVVDAAAEAFAAALHQWRTGRSLSKKQLAAEMGFDPSYVSHVEARRHRPTEDFARRAELVLRSGGVIWQRYREYDEAREAAASAERQPRSAAGSERWIPATGGLLVEAERSRLTYLNGDYRCVVRRDLIQRRHGAGHPVSGTDLRGSLSRRA
jgi:transcriptional regulator with XRE-family HTH domain